MIAYVGMQPTSALLLSVAKKELDGLQTTVARFLQAGRAIPMTSKSFTDAQNYQTAYSLSPQDSIIYAAIISDLQQIKPDKKCFISRNWKDFKIPGILAELATYNCVYIENFADGLAFTRS